MKSVNIHYAKTHLSNLINQIESGEEFVIARNGQPVARLLPMPPVTPRQPGRFEGEIELLENFSDPLSDSELEEVVTGHPSDPLIEL